jgi:SAM-dependent methyltransferase
LSTAAKWDGKHAAASDVIEPPDALVVEAIQGLTPGRALDVASGRGRNAVYLAQRGWSVCAVDFSQVALGILKQATPRVETIVADLTDPETSIPRDSFDLVCNCRYLQRDLFPRLADALRPGGLLVALIAMVDDDPAVREMNSEYLLREGELRELIAGLEVQRYAEVKRAPGARRMAECIAIRPFTAP